MAETPAGPVLHPVKALCGVALRDGDWRAFTEAELRPCLLPGETPIVLADFPSQGEWSVSVRFKPPGRWYDRRASGEGICHQPSNHPTGT